MTLNERRNIFKIRHEIHKTDPKTGQTSPRCDRDKILPAFGNTKTNICMFFLTNKDTCLCNLVFVSCLGRIEDSDAE